MSAYQLVAVLILVMLLAAAVFRSLRTQRSRTSSRRPDDRQLIGFGYRDDDRYWFLGGFLYYNRDDPALFVVNRWGIGITVNLGHPLGMPVAVGILVLLVVLAILPLLFPALNTSRYGCHPSTGCHLLP